MSLCESLRGSRPQHPSTRRQSMVRCSSIQFGAHQKRFDGLQLTGRGLEEFVDRFNITSVVYDLHIPHAHCQGGIGAVVEGVVLELGKEERAEQCRAYGALRDADDLLIVVVPYLSS